MDITQIVGVIGLCVTFATITYRLQKKNSNRGKESIGRSAQILVIGTIVCVIATVAQLLQAVPTERYDRRFFFNVGILALCGVSMVGLSVAGRPVHRHRHNH